MTNTKFNISVDDIAEALKNGATPDDIADSLSKALNDAMERNKKEDAKKKKQEKIADMEFILGAIIEFIDRWYKTAENAEVIDSFIEEMNDAETWVNAIDDEVVPALESLSKLNELVEQFNALGAKDLFASKEIDRTIRNADSAKIKPTPHTIGTNINDNIELKVPTDEQVIQNFLKKMGL